MTASHINSGSLPQLVTQGIIISIHGAIGSSAQIVAPPNHPLHEANSIHAIQSDAIPREARLDINHLIHVGQVVLLGVNILLQRVTHREIIGLVIPRIDPWVDHGLLAQHHAHARADGGNKIVLPHPP